jgi:hypothetical protein
MRSFAALTHTWLATCSHFVTKLLLRSTELHLSRFDAYKRLECTAPAVPLENPPRLFFIQYLPHLYTVLIIIY